MSHVLLAAIAVVLLVFAAAQLKYTGWAIAVCNTASPLCDYPIPLIVLAVILAGLFLLMRLVG